MRSRFLTLWCCLSLLPILSAQRGIQTLNDLGVESLVKNVFIKGDCRNVRNITAIGDETLGIGQFNNSADIIGIGDGIILSTGKIDLAQGPNVDNESGFALNNLSDDLDLNVLATDTLFDATGIEFEFVPLGDRVTFRYVFASEEYCEFVTTSFNDVFGFFVSGPGINGTFDNNAINVAILNGTTENVSINTVNHLLNENLYVSNITTIDAQNCELPYDPTYQDLIEYDGFTVPLVASFSVIPCETYRIRLVLGDVGDPILDSAVFLETNSFDLGESISLRAEVPGSDDAVAYEGCVNAQFVFTRSGSTNQDLTVEYNISPDSKAINGVDFETIPMSITIPAGETSFILPITIFDDNIAEGPENLKLELVYACDCIDPNLSELIINDPLDDLSANIPPITACANQQFNITPQIIGGNPPFDFFWETGATTDTLTSSISESTNYAVTITDFCGDSIFGVANIGIQNIPTATFMGTYDFCEIALTGIPIQLEGSPPWSLEYSIDDLPQTPIQDIRSAPFLLPTPAEGTYELTAFKDAFCNGNIIGSAEVESTFFIETDIVPPSCPNRSDGSIEITQLDAIAPFTIEWNIETNDDDLFLSNLSENTYLLTITDGDSCRYQKTFDLVATSNNIEDCAPIYIPNSFSPNNDGINDIFSIFFDPNSEIINISSLQIYNRWGALLFQQTNFLPHNGTTGWDGEYKKNPQNSGVYVYKILVDFEDGTQLLLSGDVTLIR